MEPSLPQPLDVTELTQQASSLLTPETMAALVDLAVSWTVTGVGALVVLLAGLWVAGRLKRITASAIIRAPNLDETLAKFFASIVYYTVLAFVVIAVLSMFGIQTTGLAALIGATGLAIGLALQGTLGHVASGVMLLAFRPFRIGDYVTVAGQAGTVKEINLFTTELATPDNIKIIVPNGDVYGSSIVNYSAHDTRRVDIVMGISYTDDIDKAIASLDAVVSADERILTIPEKQIVVGNLGDSSVDIFVRVWCGAGDYWPVKFDLTKAFKQRFDADGVDIPFPTRTVVNQSG